MACCSSWKMFSWRSRSRVTSATLHSVAAPAGPLDRANLHAVPRRALEAPSGGERRISSLRSLPSRAAWASR